jgi:hypothetical protein
VSPPGVDLHVGKVLANDGSGNDGSERLGGPSETDAWPLPTVSLYTDDAQRLMDRVRHDLTTVNITSLLCLRICTNWCDVKSGCARRAAHPPQGE